LKCIKCGSENVKIMVDITISLHPKYIRRLTKKAFQSKDVRLCGANWGEATIMCADCNHCHKGL
jgi:hypothetical protein